MADHLKRAQRRWDNRGDIPIMTVVVVLMGSALVAIATAAAALAGHAVVAQSRLRAEGQARSLGESALSVFYSNLQADPNYFSNGGSFPGADGNWHIFGPNGAIESCPDQNGVAGLPAPAGPGCWALQVQETDQGAGAGGTLSTGTGQANQAATVTAYTHVDCHGTLASCTSAEVVQHLDRRDFLDFLYFTNNQAMDGSFTGSDLCASGSGCSEPAYYTGDIVYGPVYTQGQVFACGTPVFEGLVEATGDPVWTTPAGVKSCAGSAPDFAGGQAPNQPALPLPSSDTYLSDLASQAGSPWTGQPSYNFSGNVTVVADGSSLTVTYGGVQKTGVPYPSDGVLSASGDIYVQGTVAGQLTLAAAGNVYVTGNLDYACATSGPVPSKCNDYTGLVAGGSVFIDDSGSSVTLDAAMLAMSHSVSINPSDLGPCSASCPTLHIYGSMASQFRGVFGAYDGSGTVGEGFVKDFHYDYRLFHNSPPWMLSSQTGGWDASAPVVVGAPASNPVIANSQQPAATTTTLPPPPTTTTTVPPNQLATPAPACQSANEVGYGSAVASQTSFEIPICRTVPSGTPVLVGVSTFTSSPSTSVTDTAGDAYSLVASQPGVYLFGSVLANPLPAGSDITVNATGQYGMSGIAEAVPGATLTPDQASIGGYEVLSPVSASYRTTTTEDDLLFLAAGGTEPATVTPSSMATDQVISGVSTVFSSREVSYGTHALGMSWPDTADARSWMAVALEMSGAQPASSTCPSSTDLGQASVADSGQAETFSFPVCRSVSPNAPVLVGVYTASTSASTGVVDSAGNSYSLIASQPGVYLYGTSNPNGLQPGDEVTVTATGNWGLDGIAEALPGVSLSPDQGSQGAQLVTPPVNVSYTTTMTSDDVIFMAAGGYEEASISPSPTVNDQLVNGMSAVFTASEVPDGSYSLSSNWSPSNTARSWMLVALAMQGATPALHVSGFSPSSAEPGQHVTISGNGFGSSQGSGYVHLIDNSNGVSWGAPGNAATFTVDSWSNTQIVFTVPTPSGTDGEYRVNPGDNVQVDVHTSSGLTSNKATLGITAPSCPSSTDLAQGTTADNGSWTSFSFLTCSAVAADTPVLVAVYTGSSSSTPVVTDSTGSSYSLIASQPGVYLLGTTNPNGFFADEVITVQAQGDWGLDAIAEVAPGVTFTPEQASQGGYLVGSPVNVNYGTTMTEDDLLFLAAGGTAEASVSMPNLAVDDQIITGMSGVFASGEVSYGGHSLSMSWPDTGDSRSWMVVALEMQGATSPPPVSTSFPSPTSTTGCSVQTWTVPGGVHSIEAQALGGTGGQAYDALENAYVGGGPGGSVSGTLAVNPGDVLDIYVASAAEFGNGGCGYGTGGASEGGGGGGSSAIVDTSTGQVLVVAGGGGGALSDPYMDGTAGWGYNGGDPNGGGAPSNGDTGYSWTCEGGVGAAQGGPGGGGGSWWNPGWPGSWQPAYCGLSSSMDGTANYPGSAGSGPGAGNGGAGGNQYGASNSYGGGGGAGYYGGGGGGAYSVIPSGGGDSQPYAGPGAGGSSWANPSYASGVSYGTGPAAPAPGSVSITYTP
jgi:protein involved in polysaccharide export with SLBB domain